MPLARIACLCVALLAGQAFSQPEPRTGKGAKAPAISGINPDGNALGETDLAGKTVVVAFWELDAKGSGMPLEELREVRRLNDVLILTVCVNGGRHWDAWSKLLLDQGKVNYGDGERRFIDDSRWWNVVEASSRRQTATAYGATTFPAFYIIKPDGTLGGVRVPTTELKASVQKLQR